MKTADVHHGEMVSLYLKGSRQARLGRPLPQWAEYRVFPRSGSALTLFSVFVPDNNRLHFNTVDPANKFWWPAVNGIVYSFRHREDAERLVEELTRHFESESNKEAESNGKDPSVPPAQG